MSEDNASAMDYDSHERTYEAFINFSKIGTVAVLNIVVCLILFAFGGTTAVVFGWLMLIATLVATAIGMALGASGWIPPTAVFGLTVVLAVLMV
ncbi:aa3-type cytochrome c oxidase subunit IV [Roseibium denhamense]|uniref:Aa3 type cytochrome c oxidase subunit IV n=1 Tax=Roseibium denhamense TaxID=76305 RepID=A0ABY1NKT0_9HYPH|nr:aa3-type cytochrome c oxidase subunit IV [Roseibium denhamense]MTI06817.1 aa3-type cytochrome c oxidase subunit IV [Roseibium denhamense]SMP11574.1 aa3 type cytochrome c oxidase subunit IV [Roseibium denhamense]